MLTLVRVMVVWMVSSDLNGMLQVAFMAQCKASTGNKRPLAELQKFSVPLFPVPAKIRTEYLRLETTSSVTTYLARF
jgi:hypothetical protein